MKPDILSIIIVGLIISFTGLTFFMYSAGSTMRSSGTQSPNTLATNAFLASYGLNNGTNVSYVYRPGAVNYMVLDCNYGFVPSILYVPAEFQLQNETAFSMYNNIVREGALYTICSVYPDASFCAGIKRELFNMTVNVINYSQINTSFSVYEKAVSSLYNNLSSNILNNNQFTPLVTDFKLLTSANGSLNSMLNALIDLQQIPDTVVLYPNGTRIDAGFSLPVPFQYPLTHFLGINPCNSSLNIFNLVTNAIDFNTTTYDNILSNSGAKITNVCIRTSTNKCNDTELKAFNMSFYV